jgi:predicted RNA-binding Zn-ribbon protein involved in translation (DUF1610 family)
MSGRVMAVSDRRRASACPECGGAKHYVLVDHDGAMVIRRENITAVKCANCENTIPVNNDP